MEGYIKLWRRLLAWEWYADHGMTRVFLHLLLSANHAPNSWRGIHIERGQTVTSLSKISAEAGFTIKQIRGILKRLERTGEVTCKGTNKYTIITLCNYDTYQSGELEKGTQKGTQDGKQKARTETNGGQTKGKQRATNKNDKKEKNEKKEEVVGIFSSELEKYRRPVQDVVLMVDAYGRWIDHRLAKKLPVNAELARRDAGRCCGYRTQKKKITPPRPFVAASVVVDLLEASICEETWKDWFYDDAVARAISGGDDKPPYKKKTLGGIDDPFGNGALGGEPEDEY